MILKTNTVNAFVWWRTLFRLCLVLLLSYITIHQGVMPTKAQTTTSTQSAEVSAPAAPSNLTGVTGSASHIILTWSDNSNNESGFKIERRKTNTDLWQYVGRTPPNTTTFESVGLLGETTYDHRVYAYNDVGNSPRTVSARPVTTLQVPAQPRGTVVAGATTESVRKGEGTFVKLNNGRLMLIYSAFAGVSDLALSRIVSKVSTDGGNTWSDDRIIFFDPKISLLLPSVIRLGNGEIGLAYSKLLSGSSAVKIFRYTKDEGETWSDEIPLSDGSMRYMTGSHDRLIKLSNNRILNLIHGKMPGINVGTHLGTHVFASDDSGRTWVRKTSAPLTVPYNPFDKGEHGFWETTAVEIARGQIYMLGRTATGWLYESRSTDFGDTWSAPAQSNILNPLAPARLEKIPGTNTLIVIRNPHTNMNESWHGGNRFILSSQTSDDGGATWKNYKEIFYDQRANWYDYPAIFWDADKLHITCRDITRTKESWATSDVRYVALPKEWFTHPSSAGGNR